MFDPEFYGDAQVWEVGSRMYGLNTAASDFDYVGVSYDPALIRDPLRDSHVTNVRDQEVIHSASKFAALIAKGNPNVMDLVYNKPLQKNRFVAGLVGEVAPYAVTRNLVNSTIGYLREQKRRGFVQSSKHGVRPEHRELGYDPKYIMHCLRMSFFLRGLLDTGAYYYLSEDERAFLMQVRSGTMSFDDINTIVTDSTAHIEELDTSSFSDGEVLRRVISEYFVSYNDV